MFSVSVEFLHGVFRGDPDGVAGTGHLDRGEWPPAPARLFAAFVAADGTGLNCRVTDGSELEWLAALPAPNIRAVAGRQTCHQKLEGRYVVRHKGAAEKNTHQEYVGRTGALVRPGVRVAMRDPRVVYDWPQAAEPPGDVLAALQRRAARVGYLGTSDSPVRVAVFADTALSGPDDEFIPDHTSWDRTIAVAAPGDLAVLDRMYTDWCAHGAAISRAQFPALRHGAHYRSPDRDKEVDRGGVAAWLCLEPALSGRRISAVTDIFKKAVLDKYQRLWGDPPSILHGHGFAGPGYDLVRYLALPDAGFRWSRGRLHGLALWVPPGTDAAERRKIRDAARAIRQLAGNGLDVRVTPREDDDRPQARRPDRWCCPSRRWATAVPAIHERRGILDADGVARWCRHAGLPEPAGFRTSRTRLVPGALDLAPIEVNRPGRPGRPYSHVELHFDDPVPGPVVIGAGRQRGFGLCVPVQEDGQ
ncbi:MAG: type I-U CRISPR-associated protein Cas5/Cas6 [Rhodobacteraceae bacterium]|nr:type I-U CRISPR-associated protein Cas5/Cas6 [Paracoccaceae bacterium]